MASALEVRRLANQIEHNLAGMHGGLAADIVRNARMHSAMAQAQTPDLATLTAYLRDCAKEYARRAGWVDTARTSDYGPAVAAELEQRGIAAAEIDNALASVREAVAILERPVASFDDVVTACDQVLARVPPPLSLWPE